MGLGDVERWGLAMLRGEARRDEIQGTAGVKRDENGSRRRCRIQARWNNGEARGRMEMKSQG